MINPIETLEKNGTTLKIYADDMPFNPRTEFDNLGCMVCFHNRYDLGDKGHGYNPDDFNGWEELKGKIEEDSAPLLAILPVYMYDHSGITISTAPFSCSWDSGQIGWIYMTEAMALDSDIDAEKAEAYLKGEVETYNHYLTGETYRFEKTGPDGEEDSCSGFYGSDHKASGLFENAGWEE